MKNKRQRRFIVLGSLLAFCAFVLSLYLPLVYELAREAEGVKVYPTIMAKVLFLGIIPVYWSMAKMGVVMDAMHLSRLMVVMVGFTISFAIASAACFAVARRTRKTPNPTPDQLTKRFKIISASCLVGTWSMVAILFFSIRYRVEIETIYVEMWLNDVIPEMLIFAPNESTRLIEFQTRAGERTVELSPYPNGLMKLWNDKWVYLEVYSSHGSGSIILAKTSDGDVYACNGHVCPTTQIVLKDPPEIPGELKLEEFLDSRVSLSFGDEGSPVWQCVNDWESRSFFGVTFPDEKALIDAGSRIKLASTEDRVARILGSCSSSSSGGGGGFEKHWENGNTTLTVRFKYGYGVLAVYYTKGDGKPIYFCK